MANAPVRVKAPVKKAGLDKEDRLILWSDFKGQADALVEQINMKTFRKEHAANLEHFEKVFMEGSPEDIESANKGYLERLKALKDNPKERGAFLLKHITKANNDLTEATRLVFKSSQEMKDAADDALNVFAPDSDEIGFVHQVNQRVEQLAGKAGDNLDQVNGLNQVRLRMVEALIEGDWPTVLELTKGLETIEKNMGP